MHMKLKKGDNVLVMKGKDRGKTGKILRVLSPGRTVVIEGVNIRMRHKRPRRAGTKGQRVSMPVPLSSANVKIVCSKCGKPARIGYRMEQERKYRICKKCGADPG